MQKELEAWLLDRGYAEEESGYGHVSAEDLAQALIESGWIKEERED